MYCCFEALRSTGGLLTKPIWRHTDSTYFPREQTAALSSCSNQDVAMSTQAEPKRNERDIEVNLYFLCLTASPLIYVFRGVLMLPPIKDILAHTCKVCHVIIMEKAPMTWDHVGITVNILGWLHIRNRFPLRTRIPQLFWSDSANAFSCIDCFTTGVPQLGFRNRTLHLQLTSCDLRHWLVSLEV